MAEEIKQSVVKEIQTVFDTIGYKYDYIPDKSVFEISFSLRASIKETKIYLFVEDTFFIALATTPLFVTKNTSLVYEYIARVNHGLLNGNFEIDPDDGEVRYKVFVKFGDRIPSTMAIADSVSVPVNMMDRYIDGVLDVMTGAVKPADAVNAANQIGVSKDDVT